MKKLYFGGDIISMRDAGDRPEAVVADGGRIVYVGELAEAEALCGTEAERIDLAGRTLMPSFIDAHSHLSQVAQNILTCDLSGAKSFEEIQEMLKAYLEENKIDENGIVYANGYDHNFLKEEAHPDRELLDQVSGTVPIFISHSSGHMGVANSALLAAVGLTADTPDPAGGRYGRNPDGSLSGYIEEVPALMAVLLPAMSRIRGDMALQMRLAQELYLRYGVTTVQEGASMAQNVGLLAQYAASGGLKVDLAVYILENEYDQNIGKFAEYKGKYKDSLKIGGAKIILDGSPQGKSAWLSRPYEGEETYCGYPSHDDGYVEDAARRAVKGGYQLLAHCNGDAASQQFIDSYRKALKEVSDVEAAVAGETGEARAAAGQAGNGVAEAGQAGAGSAEAGQAGAGSAEAGQAGAGASEAGQAGAGSSEAGQAGTGEGETEIAGSMIAHDLRPVMIHCQTVRKDQLEQMREIGMIPSIFIGHTWFWGDIHLKNLGPVRGAGISPAKWAKDLGLVYNFHQDCPITKPDMLHSVWCAVNRITRKGRLIGPDQCIGVFDALKGVTINAAYMYHEEGQKGTLEPGKLADMVILEENPLKVNRMRIKDIRVLETIRRGETVYLNNE